MRNIHWIKKCENVPTGRNEEIEKLHELICLIPTPKTHN